MKKFSHLILATVILAFLFSAPEARAAEINKFGIHILETNETEAAADLVNSNGGDWGFITIVLRTNDLDKKKWQNFLDDCRQLHLVPLIRLATDNQDNFWRQPTTEDIDNLANVLADLNWPVQSQYIIVFNETNHVEEWGGEIDPAEYAQILDYSQKVFKARNENFQILNGGFDLAANNTATTMDVYSYWQAMNQAVPGIFNRLDGWSSHSYPNPGFLGKPTDQGRKSILGYAWEMATLKNYLGLTQNLPIFITETGWPHGQTANGRSASGTFYTPEKVAEYTQAAFKIWLADNRIKAITPFILNYHATPLDVFSWLDQEGNDYPQTTAVREMNKLSWWPEQEVAWETEAIDLPQYLPTGSTYQGKITLKNTGQSIWGEKDTLNFVSQNPLAGDLVLPEGIKINRGESYQFVFIINTPQWSENELFSWQGLEEKEIMVSFFNPSSLGSYKDNFWQKIIALVKVWWYEKTPKSSNHYPKKP
jgi:hypothetical protein